MELWTLQLLNGSRKSDCRNTNKEAATSNYEVIKWSVVHDIAFSLKVTIKKDEMVLFHI